MTIDSAGGGNGIDEFAYCVAKTLTGKIFIPTFGGFLGGYCEENLQKIADVAKIQKVNEIIIESNFGQGM